MTTLRDVARRAGVSIATVSYVLNGTRPVSPEVEARVWEAVAALQYRPNRVARGLRRKRTHVLGLIVPDSANPFFAEIARGLEDLSFAHDYSLILCNSDGDPAKEQRYLGVLIEQQVDGIALVSAGAAPAHLAILQQRGIPFVVVDREISGLAADCVLADNFQGGYLATWHLLERGHRRIACITGPPDLTSSADRVRGYRHAMAEAGIELLEEWVYRGDFRAESGYHAARFFLQLPPSIRPTAIFACNDLMAIGAMRAIGEVGLSIPHDISLVGFDDIILAAYVIPPLTTVAQPTYEMGRMAGELLLSRIQDRTRPPARHLLPVRLIVRRST